jgi:sulfur-carrier protein
LSCTVNVASPLRDYTGGAATVSAQGATLEEVLLDLDRRFPGMRFRIIDEQQRIRRHMRIFIASREAHELATPVGRNEPVHLICALSGG